MLRIYPELLMGRELNLPGRKIAKMEKIKTRKFSEMDAENLKQKPERGIKKRDMDKLVYNIKEYLKNEAEENKSKE